MTDKPDKAFDSAAGATATESTRPEAIDRPAAAIAMVTCLWHCWVDGCDRELHALEREADGLPFVIVRHLIREHGVSPETIVAREPWLATEVRDYCDVFRPGPPVEGRTGGPTKMGFAEVKT